jgi:hypothetical protein
VDDQTLKAGFRKARDAVLAGGVDLEQIYGDQDSSFFIDKGVMKGIARRFVSDSDIGH